MPDGPNDWRRVEGSHVDDLFTQPHLTISRVTKVIRDHFPKCGGIVTAAGLSGSMLVLPVALRVKVPYAVVRDKESHGANFVEGDRGVKRYVIIDDFISSGETVANVIRQIRDWNRSAPIGVVLYRHQEEKFNIHEYEYRPVKPDPRPLSTHSPCTTRVRIGRMIKRKVKVVSICSRDW
jgi:hypothetical protein